MNENDRPISGRVVIEWAREPKPEGGPFRWSVACEPGGIAPEDLVALLEDVLREERDHL